MPLNCDCFPGCWGVHVKEKRWPRITGYYGMNPDKIHSILCKTDTVPYGTFVIFEGKIYFETRDVMEIAIATIRGWLQAEYEHHSLGQYGLE